MSEGTDFRVFDLSLGCHVLPATAELAARLLRGPALSGQARDAIVDATREALYSTLNLKLSRVLVLELNAARVEGRLEGDTPEARWDDFLAGSTDPAFWHIVHSHYPALEARLSRVIANQIDAAVDLARAWHDDHDAIETLVGAPIGDIVSVAFAKGDRHAGGRSVAFVETQGGPVVFKPRSMAIDGALARLLAWLSEQGEPLSLGVAATIDRGDHGWARFVPHRFARDDDEIALFYRGIGEALALMRAIGGTDFHGENLIAHGGSPVLVDCETLFTPNITAFPTAYGQAHDRAAALVAESVLAIGLLPDRAQGLGWRGIDMSGIGGLADQQPETTVPGLIDAGTDRARIGLVSARVPRTNNHPSDTPQLERFWHHVLAGYDRLTAQLLALDGEGRLAPALASFAACPTRVVVRPTETYAELQRMLWHPVSLADEEAAADRARSVMAAMAANFAYAPTDTVVIDAEIDDLLAGDIPYFHTTPARGRLTGPAGTAWLPPRDLIAATLADWRAADVEAERHFIRSALVSAYINDGFTGDGRSHWVAEPRRGDIDRRRRAAAAKIMRALIAAAHRGDDGTIGWAAPTLTPTGWSVMPLGPDLYAGLSGLALLAGAYAAETGAGRADAVDGADDMYRRLLRTLARWEDEQTRERVEQDDVRPPPAGGYVGLGAQIWTRLALADMAADAGPDRGGTDAVVRALSIADGLRWADAGDPRDDLLYGRAGAIPPLLRLAKASGDPRPLDLAREFGTALCDAASWDGTRAWWTHAHFPNGMGGFAHGVSGVGWALAKLAAATGDARFADTARGAFAFEDALWDDADGSWCDLRGLEGVTSSAAWCHGTVGIALARLDLDPALDDPATAITLDRAVAHTLAVGMGWNHCICHGDFGAWELFDHALRLGRPVADMTREILMAQLLTGLEDHGPVCGVARDAFTPGLFTGTAGIAYQLLRAHPDARLPSALMLG